MTISSVKLPQIETPNTDIEKLKAQKPKSLEEEKTRLKRATKEFEAFFSYQLLKSMRKTIPKSSFTEGGAFSGGMGKDIFTDMFDMKLAKDMVSETDNSISSMLYKSLEKIIEAPYDAKTEEFQIKPLDKIQEKQFNPIDDKFEKIELKNEKPYKEIENRPGQMFELNHAIKNSHLVKENEILSKYGKYISDSAKKYNLDPALLISVIKAESNGDPNAVSPAGAKGLMQLIDSTATELGVENVFDPKQNIEGGAKYLKQLTERFGSTKLALAAYNAGPTNVMRYDGIPPFEETIGYVDKVIDSLKTISAIKGK